MEIREYKTYNEPEILRLYASVGWTAYTDYPDVMRKGFATTIMKHFAEHTNGVVYLHAAANATPKDMYAKMGFEIVETVYEYYLEW